MILTPDHLLGQATALLRLYPGRKPRQTEIRRAISAAYYALFHLTLTKASDEFVGARHRATPQYALACRSISHAGLRDQCLLVTKTTILDRLKPFVPPTGFGRDMRMFATALPELQDKRHVADYDPLATFTRSEAESMIAMAALGMAKFAGADAAERLRFWRCCCSPRGAGGRPNAQIVARHGAERHAGRHRSVGWGGLMARSKCARHVYRYRA